MTSYQPRQQTPSPIEADEDAIITRWTWRDFLGVFGLMLLSSLLLMSILFALAWLAMQLFIHSPEPVGQTYLKSLALMAVLAFLVTVFLWFSDRLGIWWSRRSA